MESKVPNLLVRIYQKVSDVQVARQTQRFSDGKIGTGRIGLGVFHEALSRGGEK